MGRIFDHGNAIRLGDIENRVHVGTLAEEMHRHDRLRPTRDLLFDFVSIDVVRQRVDIREHGRRPESGHGAGRGKERERRHDDFIAGADIESREGQQERIGPIGTTDGVVRPAIFGGFGLERGHFRAKDHLAGLQDANHGSVDLVLKRDVLALNIAKGHWWSIGRHGLRSFPGGSSRSKGRNTGMG